jgi:hypothetical protein
MVYSEGLLSHGISLSLKEESSFMMGGISFSWWIRNEFDAE